MSRSGYTDDYGDDEPWRLVMWRGAVKSAFRGKRGQAFLREMEAALDAMPVKELSTHALKDDAGCVCALGAVADARGLDVTEIDPDNTEAVAATFGVADAMAREIVYMNDEGTWSRETPAQRWKRMRDWTAARITPTEGDTP